MPPFRISSELHEHVQIARYQDDEPGFLSEWVECPLEAARDLDQDAIDGWAFVEKRLSRLMTTQDGM